MDFVLDFDNCISGWTVGGGEHTSGLNAEWNLIEMMMKDNSLTVAMIMIFYLSKTLPLYAAVTATHLLISVAFEILGAQGRGSRVR